MSEASVTAIQSKGASGNSSVQSDAQVRQLESQIKDWSTCPTTPPAAKKAIVAKLQFQLDSIESDLLHRQAAVQSANKASAASAQSVGTSRTASVVSPSASTFKVDTYV